MLLGRKTTTNKQLTKMWWSSPKHIGQSLDLIRLKACLLLCVCLAYAPLMRCLYSDVYTLLFAVCGSLYVLPMHYWCMVMVVVVMEYGGGWVWLQCMVVFVEMVYNWGWWFVVECSYVWWCVNILNGCGGDDDVGDGSAVPFTILDRFGPNKN